MRRTTIGEATLLAEQVLGVPFFANTVDCTQRINGDRWDMLTFEVNCNIRTPFMAGQGVSPDPSRKLHKEFKQGSFSGVYDETENKLTVSRNQVDLYSFNLPALEVGDKVVSVVPDRARWIYVIIHDEDLSAVSLPRFITEEDLNPHEEPQCEALFRDSITKGAPHRCGRPEDHLGEHQYIADDYNGTFNPGGAASSPQKMFGIPTPCVTCGLILVDNGSKEEMHCFSCGYWLDQSREQREKAFVIDGTHYRAGKGGFGGATYHVKRKNGSEYKGSLWYQGPVPTQFRHLLPDDADFVGQRPPS